MCVCVCVCEREREREVEMMVEVNENECMAWLTNETSFLAIHMPECSQLLQR